MSLLADEFSPAELSALRLDGHAFLVHGSYLAADEPDVLSNRVLIARCGAPGQLIVDRLSAAWVWEALPTPPNVAQFCVAMTARSTKLASRWDARHVRLQPHDVVRTASGTVTSPWRTVLQLLRWPPLLPVPEQHRIAMRLLDRCGLSAESALERFAREQAPNVRGQFAEPLRDLLLG